MSGLFSAGGSGEERLPGAVQMLSLVFSPDGSQLAGVGAEARVAVWNLNEVRRSLAEFGLEWDRPETSASNL